MEKKTMGTFLAALRKANGMTQKDVAERLAVTDKAVSRWERDEALPDITFLPALAEMFGVTCDELLKGEKATEPVDDTSENKKSEKQRRIMINNNMLEFRKNTILSLLIAHAGAALMLVINGIKITYEKTEFMFGAYVTIKEPGYPNPIIGEMVCLIVLLFAIYVGFCAIVKVNNLIKNNEWEDRSLLSKIIYTRNRGLRIIITMIPCIVWAVLRERDDKGIEGLFIICVAEFVIFGLGELYGVKNPNEENKITSKMIWQDVIQWILAFLVLFGTFYFDCYFPDGTALGKIGIYIYFAVLYLMLLAGSFLIGWLFTKKDKECKKKHWFINIRNLFAGVLAVVWVNTWQLYFWDWRSDGAHLGIKTNDVTGIVIPIIMVVVPAIATFIYNRKYSSKEAVK